MKKLLWIFPILILVIFIAQPVVMAQQQCANIQSGSILDSKGAPITLGYDQWGYNYQAHIFNGLYCEYDRSDSSCTGNDDSLIMKWNDAWLSNKSCDGDPYLDRHFGSNTYIGSGAWLTNEQSGWVDVSGKKRKWTYFCKIVAVPEDAKLDGGNWYTAEGLLIGAAIWGEFAVTEEVYNDPSQGAHGILTKGIAGPGFGLYKP